MVDTLRLEDFSACLDAEFACPLSNGTNYVMKLKEVESSGNLGKTGDPNQRQPFSLTFVGPGELILPQSIYLLRHATLGDLEIFIVPIAKDESGVHYQAVFS